MTPLTPLQFTTLKRLLERETTGPDLRRHLQAQHFPQSPVAFSHHIIRLQQAGLVTSRKLRRFNTRAYQLTHLGTAALTTTSAFYALPRENP